MAVSDGDDATSTRAVRQVDERIRERERQLGRRTLAGEALKAALERVGPKKLT